MSEKINPDCKCPSRCTRHGDCEACEAHHRKSGSRTHCGKTGNENEGKHETLAKKTYA
jgi:hypothetical protein